MPPVNVIDSNGQIFSLPSEQLPAAISQGFREPSPQELDHYDRVKASGGTFEGNAQALLGTAANGLTLGAFKPLLEKFSPERAEQLKIAQEANQGATVAGDIAGIAGTVVNPALGALTKAVAPIGGAISEAIPGAAGTILGGVAENAALGTAMGAPKAAAEAVTGHYEEAAETLLASGGYGGAFGFLTGTIKASGPAYKKLTGYIGERAEEGLRNQQTKALGANQADVSKLTPEKVDLIVKKAEDFGLFKVFETKGSRLKKAEDLAREAGRLKGEAVNEMTAAGLIVDTDPIFQKAIDIIDDKGKFGNTGKPYVDALESFTDDIAAQGPLTPKIADDFKMTLGPEGWDNFGRPVDTPRGYVARELYGSLKGQIVASAEQAAATNPLASKFVEASQNYDVFGDLERWALRDLNRGSNQGLKLSDLGAAGVGGQVAGVKGAITGWILNTARHEFGNMAMVKALKGGLKAGETVNGFINDWGSKALSGKVTRAARIGSINAVRELTGIRDDNEATDEVIKNLSQFGINPEYAAEILSQSVPEMSQADPRVASAIHQKSVAAAQALLAAAPKKQIADSPFETDTGYTSAQIRDFNKKIATVMNPLSAMKDLAAGRLDPDAVTLLKQVYPSLYSQMQKVIIDNAAGAKKSYNYGQKFNLSMFLGKPVDTLGSPENIKVFQDSYKKRSEKPNKSNKKPRTAQNAETAAQRIENR